MIDLHERAKAYLEAKGFTGISLKRLDSFTGKEGIVIRAMPKTLVESYYDGTAVYDQPYQIIVRRRSEAEAMETCSSIAETLEGVILASARNEYQPHGTDGQKVYTAPQEMALDEADFYAWHVRMTARIEC